MLGVQLYITSSDELRQEVTPVVNDPEGFFRQKPKGGLWTSSYRAESEDSGWVEWCRGASFGDPDGKQWFLLAPHPDCRLYTIDSLEDFSQCLMEYGSPAPLAQEYPSFAMKRTIDFEKLALEYDGLRLTEQGNEETHLSFPNDMNAWDCESTLWFRWRFTQIEKIATVGIKVS